MKGVVIAGTSSGVGKTVVTLAVLRALEDLGEDPQPAKVGPDFIDPSHHKALTGKPSRNLDLWLEGERGVIENYNRGRGSICVAEGVMGLYDGRRSSTARVAEFLGLPVVIVVDGSAGMESAGATALGFREYAAYQGLDLEVAGIIAQRTRGGKHEKGIIDGLPEGLEYFGRIPPVEELEIPERHLGLYMGSQATLSKKELDRATENIDPGKLAELAREPSIRAVNQGLDHGEREDLKIGMAYDSAFNFVYPATREVLETAKLVPFSPLAGDEIPDLDGVYLPGGYPELYPKELAESPTIRQLEIKAREGLPVFGECGGMMVMTDAITTKEGDRYRMAGILPAEVEMVEGLQGLGYTELEARADSPIEKTGETLHGHEFHYSRIETGSGPNYAFDVVTVKYIFQQFLGIVAVLYHVNVPVYRVTDLRDVFPTFTYSFLYRSLVH